MASNSSKHECVEMLRKAYPIRSLIHVGDLNKHALSEYAGWVPERAVFVMPDVERYHSLARDVEAHSGWRSIRAVVGEIEAEREYFTASNPRESGLLAPEFLAPIWRNIKTLSRQRVPVLTLDDLLAVGGNEPPANWIVINCLPALTVIQGAISCLSRCDVVVARAVVDDSAPVDAAVKLSALDEYLTARGFDRVAVHQERHPALGSATYARGRRAEELEVERDGEPRLAQVLRPQVEAANLDRDHISGESPPDLQSAAEHQASIDQITAERDEQTRVANQRHKELQQAFCERDEKSHLAQELQRTVDELTVDRDRISQELAEQLRLMAERQAVLDQITADRDDKIRSVAKLQQLLVERQALIDQISADRDDKVSSASELQQLLVERQAVVEQITADRDDKNRSASELQQLLVERQALIDQMTTDRDEQTRLANQRYKEREQAVGERDAQTHVVHELRAKIEQLSGTAAQDGQKLSEAAERILALNRDLDARGERISKLQSEIGNLGGARDKAAAEVLELRGQLERLNGAAQERGARVTQLEGERNELQARQLRLDREILKAEAQIDLIKDVILREKAF